MLVDPFAKPYKRYELMIRISAFTREEMLEAIDDLSDKLKVMDATPKETSSNGNTSIRLEVDNNRTKEAYFADCGIDAESKAIEDYISQLLKESNGSMSSANAILHAILNSDVWGWQGAFLHGRKKDFYQRASSRLIEMFFLLKVPVARDADDMAKGMFNFFTHDFRLAVNEVKHILNCQNRFGREKTFWIDTFESLLDLIDKASKVEV